ncbi:Ribosomal protein L34Ae [Trinorchestia longiramus]|nr:Ribosomal protein L34Ae [Trinorchestia longiramus]
MAPRLTYRRRHTYKTKSNKVRIVRTPGGRLTYQHVKKRAKAPHCAQCKRVLPGIKPARPCELHRMSKRLKTVNRAYGGQYCHACVKDRILRAFLIEEQRIVARVMKIQKMAAKSAKTEED